MKAIIKIKNEKPWWDLFFEDEFADLMLEREAPSMLAKEVDFIINELELQPGQVVFDQCCGTGEIACELAVRHIYSVGVDQSKRYIERAKRKALDTHLACEFHHADALEFVSPIIADAGLNWFTSFGYSDVDAINLKMLKNQYESLKKNARFLLDYTNPAYIFKNFTEHLILKKTLPEGELIVNKHSEVDLQRGMLISTWNYVFPDGKKLSKSGESRIYFARDLIDMLKSCGFRIIRLTGELSGSVLTKDSPRCIITAQK